MLRPVTGIALLFFYFYLTGSTIHLRSAARNSDHQTTKAVVIIIRLELNAEEDR
jgi:hypothetical protein